MDNLTNEAKFLLTSMYDVYLKKRKNKVIRKDAMFFGNLEDIHSSIMPKWQIEDVKSVCLELKKHKFISGTQASNTILFITLTTEAIASLEITFGDRANNILEFLAKIKNAIPFA
ncbi:hypothetical protein UC3_02381 [Enterococcus phoeniculicola ATCC BAA-412]|uniref:YjcQ protein n=1 Tax=Enterococcus phoeniculicola ATCC BAA-412 TaxID=1158610 RepID=R3TLZ5_9ENTE|nr:hypothetical protein UC3_02381 [Enterococcus phoeniculicola ATCC BAA-412]EOT79688.1 hypothetical protein I589_01200 [Enterococcus phoeniculicola ATCC BAA-412]